MNKNLKISFLGGVGEIGKNMTVLEYDNDIILIDAGLTFPSDEMPGIDVVIPDITYLVNNKDRIRGIVITHGHEDHIGGIPYVLKQLKVPVFGTKLTLTLLENKLREHRIDDAVLNCIRARTEVKLGAFSVEFVHVNHSITGAVALSITTPVGIIFHTGDFKIDYTPVDGETTDLARIAEIGKKGVLLLMGESTNVEIKGYTMSEKTVGANLDGLFADNIARRIIIATFASNVHRIQQILDIAKKYNRKVAFTGRSMINIAEAASKIGEIKFDKSQIIDIEKINNQLDKDLVIICTGSQGEPMSALTRMAGGEFNKVKIGINDTIIISASPIPGNEKMVYNVINNLYRLGAQVIYERLAEVHVSGHACQEELKIMHTLLKPKYFIPVHGEYRHMKKHVLLAQSLGMPQNRTMICEIGNSVELNERMLKRGKNVPAGSVLVDGLAFGDIDSVMLKDRKQLAEDGLMVVVMGINEMSGEITSGPTLIPKGIVANTDELMFEAKAQLMNVLNSMDLKSGAVRANLKQTIRKTVRNFFNRQIKQTPMVMPIILEL